jgi:hypothetical protein
MADEVKSSFGGFDAVFDQFLSPNNIDGENNEHTISPEEIEKEMQKFDTLDDDDDNVGSNSKKDGKEATELKTNSKKDVSTKTSIKQAVSKKDNDSNESKDDNDIDDSEDSEDIDESKNEDSTSSKENSDEDGEVEESDLVDAFSDIFAEELGWEFNEGEKPTSIKELVAYMQELIETNSEPKYASDEIKELDEFIKQGGNVKEYFNSLYATEVDPDKIDIAKENNQKTVIRENLRNRGYSEARIEKLVSRYEELGALEEEAQDSLEELKDFKEKTKKQLLEQTKKQYEQSVKSQLEFVKNVESLIKDAKDIRGIPMSEKDKRALTEYIFKPTTSGRTSYQEEYNSDLKNLIESAFFTMKKNTLVQQIERKASTDAVKNLKLKLKAKGKSTKNTESDMSDTNSGKVRQLWEIASKELI